MNNREQTAYNAPDKGSKKGRSETQKAGAAVQKKYAARRRFPLLFGIGLTTIMAIAWQNAILSGTVSSDSENTGTAIQRRARRLPREYSDYSRNAARYRQTAA